MYICIQLNSIMEDEEIIQLKDIQDFFNEMLENGILVNEKMLWGFYFTDIDAVLLEKIAKELQKEDFKVYEIYVAEDEEGNELDYFCLRTEKEITYTIDSLFEQSNDFYALEQKFEIQSYDGFDVNFIELDEKNN